jgi:hypothetical protein
MESKGQNRSLMFAGLGCAGMAAAALALMAALTTGPHSAMRAAASAGDGVTHLRVTNEVILPGVTRLGINLGEQNYYDSGQMMRNLLYRNPGFEGMAYRSILHCLEGGAQSCTDTRHSFAWGAGFWDGASFEVLDGAAVGRKGGIQSSGPRDGGYGLTLSGSGAAIGAGDWLAVSKQMPGDAASGWWPAVQGGARRS